MNSIARTFQKQNQQGNAVLIGYIMAGDQTPQQTPEIADALIRGGVDILELGLPFSDPIADGPTIQAASIRALTSNTTPMNVLRIAKQIKQKHNDVPIVIMTYFNPVFKIGLNFFCKTAKESQVDGFIIPDLPVEEAEEFKKTAETYKIDTIFLAAPSTSNERLPKIVAACSGFLYLISHFGVTGAKSNVEDSTIQLIKRVKPFANGKVPLAVGFGISKPEHIRRIIAAGADATIVGSSFIKIIQENTKTMLKDLQSAARKFKDATKIIDS
jgi:tryptophan synthase alpha chain